MIPGCGSSLRDLNKRICGSNSLVELQEKFDQRIFAIHPPEGKNPAKYCEASKSANEDNYVQMLRSRWVGARSNTPPRYTLRRTLPDKDRPNDCVFRCDGEDVGLCPNALCNLRWGASIPHRVMMISSAAAMMTMSR
jgi:hypothetical protein